MTNKELIIQQFKLLENQIKIDIDNLTDKNKKTIQMFRLKSISNVIKQLEQIKEINNIDDIKNLHLKGIGKGSLQRIEEILKTKKLSEIKITNNSYLPFIDELKQIFGIGRKKAYELFKYHNIKSINDLKEKYKNNQINLPSVIIKGLKYIDVIQLNIKRKYIDKINTILLETLTEINTDLLGLTCGSYRREKKTSNDIDFVLCNKNLKTQQNIDNHNINYLHTFISTLKNKNLIIESLTKDTVHTKYMGICKIDNIYCRIDIRYIPFNSYYYAILYFTGSKDLNTKMRYVAKSMNYTLNEYGLFDENKKLIVAKSEKHIFELLNLEYLSPKDR